jgi:short-subunit dehydrogenase
MRSAEGQLRGHVAFLTGASSGIGAALARELAHRGADVALAARRVDRLEALAAELQGRGRRALALACDVTRDGDLERAVAATHDGLGRVTVAVANAGFGVAGPVERLTLDDYRRQFDTNVFGVLRTVWATLDDVKAARGRVAIIGSVSGHLGLPRASAYAMSKFAVRALAQSLGHELAPHGVSVTLVSPGFVDSEIRRVDNRGVLRADAPDGIPRLLRMRTDTAARQIADAIVRRRPEVVITLHGKLAVFFQRHAPWLVTRVIRGLAVRGRREPGPAA